MREWQSDKPGGYLLPPEGAEIATLFIYDLLEKKKPFKIEYPNGFIQITLL